ncbi:MAG: fibronectin type III domain-containing protein, partial [Flavobacteriales bacterium]
NQYGYVYLYVRSVCGDGYTSGYSELQFEVVPSCELALDLSSTDASCVDGDGTISATVTGAYGDYTLDFGDIDPLSLSAGTYTVTVTDEGGCSVSHDITVDQEDVDGVSVSAASNSFCSGSSVLLTATSGFASYQWYDANGLIIDATSVTYSATAGGDYYVIVANSDGCSSTSGSENLVDISIAAPTSLEVEDIYTTSVSLDWDATSPSGAYNIQYSDDGGSTWTVISNYYSSGINLNGLSSNTTYMFEVTSVSYGCESTASTISFTTIQGCNTPDNLLLSATPTDVTFTWDAISNAESYNVVYAYSGGYWLSETVTGNSLTINHNGYGIAYFYIRTDCGNGYNSAWSDLQSISIPACVLSLDLSSTDASCADGDGTISASVVGAFGDYTLDFGNIDPLAVSAGTYTVTVTDDGGCSVSHTITVDQEDAPEVSVSAASATFCAGSSVVLTATSGFASYQWYDANGLIADATSSTYSATAGGDYYVVITNSSACSSTSESVTLTSFSLTAPTSLVLEGISTNTASLDWDATSPSGAYNIRYSADGGSTWTTLENYYSSGINLSGLLSATNYLFEVTSVSYGCESTASTISFTTIQGCNTPDNLLLTATPFEVSFTWDAISNAESYTVVYAYSGGGWSTQTVTDNELTINHNGYGTAYFYILTDCGNGYASAWSSLQSISIPPCNLSLDLSSTDASCADGDGAISAAVTGAIGDYTVDFGNIDPLAVSAGTYTVTVTDDGGCSVSHDITVDQEEAPSVEASTDNTILCSGSSVVLTATPGFASYQWYDANGLIIDATSVTYSATAGGDYYVVAANSSGCSATSDALSLTIISLTAPTSLVLEGISTNTASLDWDATSPSGAYNIQYSADGGSTWTVISSYYGSGMNLNGLESGVTYQFEVTSVSYGCESSASTISFTTVQGCDTPINISQQVQGSEVVLSWDAIGNADSYEITYNIGGQGWQSATVSTNSLTVPFNYGYSNSFYVRTVCSNGLNSDWSALQSFTFTCDAPTNFTISDDGGVVTFSWDDMGAEEYNIIYYAGSGWINEYVSGTSLQVSGVSPFYTVYGYLRSVCNSSSSFVSPWIFEYHTTSSGGRFAQANDFSVNVYPNPTNGLVNINIDVEKEDSYSIRLVDSFGKKVFDKNESLSRGQVNYQIDLTSYANGVYHLQIINGENVRNERIIVQ